MLFDYFLINLELEKDITNGMNNSKNLTDNALCFIREIEDIENKFSSIPAIAKKFIDLDKNNKIDESAIELLKKLKNEKIPSLLPETNIIRMSVSFS